MKAIIKGYGLLDFQTGEISKDILILRKTEVFGGSWMRVYQDAREILAKKHLHGESLNVMLYLEAKAGYNNIIPSRKKVAEALSMNITNVSRAFKELITAEVLVTDKEMGTLILNPYFYWKGTQGQLKECLKRIDETGYVKQLQEKLTHSGNAKCT